MDTPVKLWEHEYEAGSFLWIVHHVYFQYYSILIFVVCAGVMIGVSYRTKEPDYDAISGLTYGTLTADQRRESRGSWGWGEVAASAGVLIAIIAAYLYFIG